MRKVAMIIAMMMLLTACSPANINNKQEINEENQSSITATVGDSNGEKEKTTNDQDSYEKIAQEHTTSEGNRVTEYEDGYTTILSPEGKMAIVKTPYPADYTIRNNHELEELPEDEGTEFVHDLRSKDISSIDLSNKLEYLLISDFDDHTKWPESVPKEYDIEKIKKNGMDPGLGVGELHKKGITGQGVGIAIIDQPLLVEHVEYRDQLKLYEEIHENTDTAQMHGPAVASIAVGKNTGVAPGADLYYIAETHGVYTENSFNWDLYWVAKSIDRIIEINKTLPKDRKIRVISISLGIDNPTMKNGKLVQEAIKRASDEGIYTIAVGNSFFGLGREPLGDPNDLASYTKGYFWKNANSNMIGNNLLVPMDSRCLASPTGEDKYVFYYSGGLSWAVPYTAGLYALSCQVNPDITPKEFNVAAKKTATKINLDSSNDKYYILNPEALINEIEK